MLPERCTKSTSKWRSRVLVSVTMTSALILGFSPNPARAVATFRIHNYKASGKCIGIAGGNGGDWYCTTNADQTWHWGDSVQGSSYHLLINGNGQCLQGFSTSSQISASYVCDPSFGGEGWIAITGSYGFFLKNKAVGGIIAVDGGSTANGAALVFWSATGTLDQYWSLY